MIPRLTMDRPQLFSVALKSAGISCAEFVRRYLDEPAADSVVWGVAAGRRKSARVSAAIDRFLKDEAPRVTRAFEGYRQAA